MTEKEARAYYYNNKFQEATQALEKKFHRRFDSECLSRLLGHHFERDDVHLFLAFHADIMGIDLVKILISEYRSVIAQVRFDSQEFDFILEDKLEKAKIKE